MQSDDVTQCLVNGERKGDPQGMPGKQPTFKGSRGPRSSPRIKREDQREPMAEGALKEGHAHRLP